MYIITIDTGTTNTRVKLWKEGRVLGFFTVNVGVRDTSITGSKEKLKQAVRDAIAQALGEARLESREVGLHLASGMITSNVGLYEVPHASAPQGIHELAEQMVCATIPEVAEQPIWFVPGVKNSLEAVTVENFEAMDIMRGEEVEALGLLSHINRQGPALFILPGSHTKFVRIDHEGRIIGCITTLAGELLTVLSNQTILASSLDKDLVQVVEDRMAHLGAEQARKFGLTKTCFSVRILDQFTDTSLNGKVNFLAGAIAATDLQAVKCGSVLGDCRDIPIIVGGSNAMAGIFEILVCQDEYFHGELVTVNSDEMKEQAGFGAILVARARGLCS